MKANNLTENQENMACFLLFLGLIFLIIGSIFEKNSSVNFWVIGYYFLGWILLLNSIFIMYPRRINIKLKTMLIFISSIILTLSSIVNKI